MGRVGIVAHGGTCAFGFRLWLLILGMWADAMGGGQIVQIRHQRVIFRRGMQSGPRACIRPGSVLGSSRLGMLASGFGTRNFDREIGEQ